MKDRLLWGWRLLGLWRMLCSDREGWDSPPPGVVLHLFTHTAVPIWLVLSPFVGNVAVRGVVVLHCSVQQGGKRSRAILRSAELLFAHHTQC